jgi:vancomycin resistance protein YoaR
VNQLKFAWIIGLMLLAQPSHVSDELTIVHGQEPIMTIRRSDLSSSLYGFGFPSIDIQKFQTISDQLNKQIRKEAIDAIIDENGNIIPELPGMELNKAIFKEQFFTYFYQKGSSTLEVPVRTVYPKVDSELLTQIRSQKIGHYVTYFNSHNKARSHNISLAATAINNQVVLPGETFSFNQTVGKRTKAKGYLPAPIIVKGELAEGVGGGICQVSSTLFNAVDRSGLQILQRYSHSRRVPYVPPGRDATVSWYGPDFSFKNKYNQPILIQAKAQFGMMMILLFSSDEINFKPKHVPSSNNQLPPETERKKYFLNEETNRISQYKKVTSTR